MTNENVEKPVERRDKSFTIKKYLGQDLTFSIRAIVNKRPWLYFSLSPLLQKDQSLAVTKQTKMVISGIWGCANTYSAAAFAVGNPNVKISHHLHIPAQTIRAVQLHIPCLVLIRHPVDALASLIARNGLEYSYDGFRWGLEDYVHFYKSIIDLNEHYIASDFKDVITAFPAVMDHVNKKFGSNFQVPDKDSDQGNEVAQRTKSLGHQRWYPLDDIKEYIRSPRLQNERLRAEEIYERFCEKNELTVRADPPKPPKERARPTPTPRGF